MQEDIPQLVSEAIAKLDRPDVPVVTTDPVGSSLDVMVDAIGALVDETVREISGAGGRLLLVGLPALGRSGGRPWKTNTNWEGFSARSREWLMSS